MTSLLASKTLSICEISLSSASAVLRNVDGVKCRPFLNVVAIETGTKNIFREVYAIFLFAIQFSDHGATTIARLAYAETEYSSLSNFALCRNTYDADAIAINKLRKLNFHVLCIGRAMRACFNIVCYKILRL